MGKPQKHSIKVCEIGEEFLKKAITNRRQIIGGKKPTDDKDLSYWELIRLISKFFKENNKEYLKLIALEYKK